MIVSVHKYKWSQGQRRAKLKRMSKVGILEFVQSNKTHFYYKIINMEEYRKRK